MFSSGSGSGYTWKRGRALYALRRNLPRRNDFVNAFRDVFLFILALEREIVRLLEIANASMGFAPDRLAVDGQRSTPLANIRLILLPGVTSGKVLILVENVPLVKFVAPILNSPSEARKLLSAENSRWSEQNGSIEYSGSLIVVVSAPADRTLNLSHPGCSTNRFCRACGEIRAIADGEAGLGEP